MDQSTPGRVVHYVLPAGSARAGNHRSAVITSDWGGMNPNLMVTLDQRDDLHGRDGGPMDLGNTNVQRAGDWHAKVWSATYDEAGAPGTWHWPERQ
jgi:hypothetical protein